MTIRLTPREYEVLARITLSEYDIANELTISVHSVRQYTSHIYRKLNAHNKAQAVIKALRYELIDLYNFRL